MKQKAKQQQKPTPENPASVQSERGFSLVVLHLNRNE